MKYFLIALLFISCTKYASDDTIMTDVYKLTVSQVKNNVLIVYKTEPKPYIRVMDVVVRYDGGEKGTVFYIPPGHTDGDATVENVIMTGYHVVTFARYWE